MTVLIISSLPAKDRDQPDHVVTLALTCCNIGSQLRKESFVVHRGTPTYLIGR